MTVHSGAAPAKLAYRINEAAKLSGICRSLLYKHIREGRLPAKQQGDRKLILHNELMRYLESLPNAPVRITTRMIPAAQE